MKYVTTKDRPWFPNSLDTSKSNAFYLYSKDANGRICIDIHLFTFKYWLERGWIREK